MTEEFKGLDFNPYDLPLAPIQYSFNIDFNLPEGLLLPAEKEDKSDAKSNSNSSS